LEEEVTVEWFAECPYTLCHGGDIGLAVVGILRTLLFGVDDAIELF
jgi:hypothetical protein